MSGFVHKIEETLHMGGHKKEEGHKGEHHGGEYKGEQHGYALSLFRVSEFKNEKGFCGAIMAAVRVFGASAGRAFMAAAKSAAKKATASGGAAAKTTEKKTVSNRSATAGIQKVVPVSSELGNFLGASQVSRTEAVKRVWEYIKLQNLQNPTNKKEIFCDAKLKTIFDGKDKVGFTEIARLLSNHFAKSA